MNGFPAVDPIPLPAPIWLFKALHIVTLSLHFVAMQIMVGGLLIAVLLSLLGRSQPAQTAASAIARRLTIVMTYVINLGVPPLLFAQVLYGRAIYTSSVAIGLRWIAVVPALILAYWLLYRFAAGLEAGKKVWWMGLVAWFVIGTIAHVYSTNMTLMLRPEVWQQMYSASALGAHLPPTDPTTIPRFLFILISGFVAAGLWMVYLGGRKTFSPADGKFLSGLGGRITAVAVIAQIAEAFVVYHAQPAVVQAGLHSHILYKMSGLGWLALSAVLFLFAAVAAFAKPISAFISWLAVLLGVLPIALMTIYRDGIRDLTLLSKGYDVWQRAVVTNWSVVGIFLAVFVAGLITVGWLISVVARATRVMESPVQP
ncbi:MAG: hypothetical protein P4L10_13345 [Acidobacteriaceae bacterium]|jgi:hypothetical protein|nr:hypothetical protein [Acidobacteriaceae bacterium]